ncbi:MAG: roadblock/LC7 domain-containing protein [Candidatus Electrothrix sp. AR4]|nr:roadblock/LC7 domain-containing protein [Candidatus Electrothrix sp. AR4]
MKTQQKLSRLAEIDGFAGAALFTPDGRLLLKCEPVDINLELIGSLANNVLRTAEKASLDMECGRSYFTFIHTEKVLILLRCLNEGKNPLGPEAGKCHIHLVLLVDNPDSFGIAKLEISKVIESLADDFRVAEIKSRRKKKNTDTVRKERSVVLKKTKEKTQTLQDVADLFDDKHIDNAFDNLLT